MIKDINDIDFKKNVLLSKILVLVDFWADWCGPCNNLLPIIEDTYKIYSETQLLIYKMNVDNNPTTTSEYNIRSIPTLIFFKNGKEKDRTTGLILKNELINKINSLIN